ncbi:MAG: hypothetical protein OXR73_38845 [Myxococcales bacterium]|nr:hypothetical protein [Myxococcales bacterium]
MLGGADNVQSRNKQQRVSVDKLVVLVLVAMGAMLGLLAVASAAGL